MFSSASCYFPLCPNILLGILPSNILGIHSFLSVRTSSTPLQNLDEIVIFAFFYKNLKVNGVEALSCFGIFFIGNMSEKYRSLITDFFEHFPTNVFITLCAQNCLIMQHNNFLHRLPLSYKSLCTVCDCVLIFLSF